MTLFDILAVYTIIFFSQGSQYIKHQFQSFKSYFVQNGEVMVQVDAKIQSQKNPIINSHRTYSEIIHYLDANWGQTKNFMAMSQLDEIFGHLSKKLNIAVISGTNGKSTTIHFTCKLFKEENLKIGAFYAPHITLYNERFSLNEESISNAAFTEIANKVIQAAEDNKIAATTKDILTMMALIFFNENNVDLALLENSGIYNLDPVMYCNVKIGAITRIVANNDTEDTHAAITNIMTMMTPSSHFVSADQNKLNLQIMSQLIEGKGSTWSMPIRKLAPLQYPFEQLHGRCAALAERITRIFIDNVLQINSNNNVSESLLNKPKGLRGRPTLEAKKVSELTPKRTIEQFWSESITTLPSRFELITTNSSNILLDNADNLDALSNLFLGIRLLSYQHNYKEISLIIACHEGQFDNEEFIKQARYFYKKASGSIAFCPTIATTIGEKTKASWDVTKITNIAKTAKIKAKAYTNFNDAYHAIKTANTSSDSLIVITGSKSIISEYKNYKETIAA